MSTTISGGNAPVLSVIKSLQASFGNKVEFLAALAKAGLIQADGTVNYGTLDNPAPTTSLDATKTPVALLNTGATTIKSNGPVLIGLGPTASVTLAGRGNDGSPAQADTVVGGSGHNTITGNRASSLLIGGTGKEYIQSGGGHDTLIGGPGRDTLIGGGQSLIKGGLGTAVIKAGANAAAHDTVYAGFGRDTIGLTDGNNLVFAPNGPGQASIRAGAGKDTIVGGGGATTIVSGSQTTISLGQGPTTLQSPKAGSFNDTIYGGANTGSLSLNVASSDVKIAPIPNTDVATITFAGGSTITTVGSVNLVFTDHTTKTVG